MATTDQTKTGGDDELSQKQEELFKELQTSFRMLRMLDLAGCEGSISRAKAHLAIFSGRVSGVLMEFLKLLVRSMDVSKGIIRSFYYLLELRSKKALEEIEAAEGTAQMIFADFNGLFDRFSKEIEEEDFKPREMGEFFMLFVHITAACRLFIQAARDRYLGKFVEEPRVLKDISVLLRKVDSALNFPPEDDFDNLLGFIYQLADALDKRSERLEEQNKSIQFLPAPGRKVFIVHGHNDKLVWEILFILNSFNVEPVVLAEMPDDGNTLIEKFEEHGRFCAFAFVIVTPDDEVDKTDLQGRPNVLFELGWFCGRFGRSKVRILRQRGTKLPSDLDGLVTIDFNEEIKEGYHKIQRTLVDNGIIDGP